VVNDDTTHLVAYSFKQSIRHTPRTVGTTDQFGSLSLTTRKPDTLLVPTNTNSATTPSAPDNNAINVDHYKCYKVKVTHGTPKFAGVTVTENDQFRNAALAVKKPKHLCTPVDKNDEGIKNPTGHLLCYTIKSSVGFTPASAFVNNQFSPETMTVVKPREFCIPSTKSLSPSGAFLDTTTDLFE
jgi:hypothetical protein